MTNNSKLKQNSQAEATKLPRGIVIVIIAILLVIFCALALLFANKASWLVKPQIASYLSKKYQEDFIVKNPECRGGGLGVKCIWSTQAYPKSNDSLKFNVHCSPGNPSDCSDQYIAALWSVQASKELQEIIDQVNKEFPDYKADSARAEIVLSGDLVDTVNRRSKYDEYKTNDSDFLFRVIIDAPNSSNKAEYIFKVIEGLRERGITSIKIDTNKNYTAHDDARCTMFFDKEETKGIRDLEKCLTIKE